MSPPPDRRAPQAVASPPSQQLLARLLGADTSDAFAQQTSRVVRQLSAELAGAAETPPGMPARLGAFRVGAALGRGGMGTVYRGVHETTGKVAALKTAPAGTELGELLHQEALALGGLDHRGVVQIFDHGEQDGVVWIAMQLVHGETLRAKIQKQWPRQGSRDARAPLTREQMRVHLGWFRDFAIALGAIHARGVVHRDIKPANLMIADDGAPYVIDFGLSLDGPEHAVVDTLAGTVPYMSPEQVLALTQLDGRTDIYSLAASLFELLSGTRLVGDDGARIGLLRQVAFTSAPKLSSRAPWVDRACDGVLAKALAKDPKDRYRTAQEFAGDLDCLVAGNEPRHARTTWSARTRRHRTTIAGALFVIALGTWVGANAYRRHADIAELRAKRERTLTLATGAADEGVRVLDRALELAPLYGESADFQDVYGRALSDFARQITPRLFQRATLMPAHVVGTTTAGQIGASARRHLAAARALAPQVRNELVVQALFVDLLERRYDDALTLGATVDNGQDERIEQLVAVANLLSGRAVDEAALRRMRADDLSSRDLAELCCRAFLLLEMSGAGETSLTEAMLRLAGEIETRMSRGSLARDARNFPAGLAALMRLRAHQPARAEDLIVERLADREHGPALSERPVFLAYAAAARYRRLILDEGHEAASVTPLVERFVSAVEAEPGLATRFVLELLVDPGAQGAGSPGFHLVTAEFLDGLSRQLARITVFPSSFVCLIQYATQAWCNRHDCQRQPLVAEDWEPLLLIAAAIARESLRMEFDTRGAADEYRGLLLSGIHIAGKPHFLSGPRREENLRLCREFRDAAVRLLPPRSVEIELAYAGVQVVADPSDTEVWKHFRAYADELRTKVELAEKSTAEAPLLSRWQNALEEVEIIEARTDAPPR